MLSTALIAKDTIREARKSGGRTVYAVSLRRDLDQAMTEAAWLMRDGRATVFQTPAFVSQWARTIGAARGTEFFLLEVRERASGRLVMLMPLVRRRAGGVIMIETPDFGLADYVGPLVSRDFSPTRRAMGRIWQQARAAVPPADIIRFVKMPARIAGKPNPLLRLAGIKPSSMTAWGAPLAAADTVWRNSVACAKRRADLDARWRKLNKRGRVEFRTARSLNEVEAFYGAMCAQRSERFATLNFPNCLAKPEIRRFYRSLLGSGEPGAPAVIQALTIDGEIIATGYGLVGNDAFHMIFPTFKAEGWRNYSPGMHLFRKSMEWSAGEGLTYYDFTVGAEGFKRDFGAREAPLYERYEALSARGLAALGWIETRRFIKGQPRLARFLCSLKSKMSFKGK
jgi:CelD/BcsL family acetyltransferase involved in cellulose biosynthesis